MAREVVHYSLGDLYDRRGLGVDLENVNGVTFGSGLVGNAAILDGVNQRLKSSNAFFHSWSGFSFEMVGWINLDTLGKNHGVFGQETTSYHCHVISTNKVRFRVAVGGNAKVIDSDELVTASTWIRVRVGYDHSAGEIFLQINEGTVKTLALGGAIDTKVSDFTLGSIATSSNNYMDGMIDHVMICKDGLFTTAELSDHYGSGSPSEFQSEIELDYNFSGSGAKVWKITAQSAEMGGSGTFASPELIITEADLPSELHDSDETSTVEASGAGSVRFSSDSAGANQMPLKVVKFVPASGGGDVLFRTRSVEDLDAGSGSDLYMWWFPSGHTKVQPPAANVFGAKHAFIGTHYELEEDPSGSAPQMLDSGLNSNDGTATGLGSGDSVAAQIGNGIDFSSADYIDVDDDDSLSFDSAFTVSLYFNMTAGQSGYRTIISKRDEALSPPADWGVNFNQTLDVFQVFFHDGSGYNTHAIDLAANFSTATWYRVDFTCEESGADVITKIYKDGVLLDTETWTSKSLGNSTARVRIGAVRYSGSDGEHFDGLLDEITIQEGALSQGQITTLHNNKKASPTLWDSTAPVNDAGAAGATTLVPADGSVSVSADASTLVQQHVIVPADGAVGVTAENTTLDTSAQIVPQDGSVSVSAEASSLVQQHVLVPADGSVAVTLDPTTLDVGTILLIPADGQIAVAADGSLIVQNHILIPADGQVAVTAESTIAAEPSDVSTGLVSMAPYYSGAVSLLDH